MAQSPDEKRLHKPPCLRYVTASILEIGHVAEW